MKGSFKSTVKFVVILVIVVGIIQSASAQCPVPGTCTFTAVSGTNYTVNAGQVLCINSPVNYSSGTITLNGGTVYVASGATLSRDITPSSASTINICGTLGSGRRFNNNTTINYYGSSSLSLDYTNGGIVNNYSNSVTVSLSNIGTTGASFTNYGTGVSASISSWNNAFSITNATGASMTVTSSSTVYSNSSIVNNGTLNWSPQLVMNSGSTLTNNGVFNATGSGANFNGATFNNNGVATFANGPTFQSGSSINNNSGASISVTNGKTDITGGSSFNNGGSLNIKDIIVQGSASLNNSSSGTITQSSGTFDVNGGTVNNNGTISPYDLKLSSGGFNMNPGSSLNIGHQVTTIDMSINTGSGCSYINLGDAIDKTNPNQPLTTGAGVSNVCGKVPYKTTDPNNVIAATNTSPIRVTMASNTNNRISNGIQVYIIGVNGNTAVNGLWTVANYNSATRSFDLVGSDGTTSGAYTGGGVVYYDVKIGTNASYVGYSNCSNPCAPLPVSLISFGAKVENGVKISWTTSSEKSNDYFVLEHSSDGINFEVLTIIKGAKNSNTIQNYIYEDNAPFTGSNYYRLKQVDLDGQSAYSSVSLVNVTGGNEWFVFPNPSSNGAFTILSGFDNGASVVITDITGTVVKEYNLSDYKTELFVSGLSNGVYFVKVQAATNHFTKKIIIL